MGTLRYVQMVLWSFFGIRRRAAATGELEKVHLPTLVVAAVALAALFGATLWGVAAFAVRTLGS